jgi:ppGpp synthetase/RelA/SpoT-type nucleotidyltranferase
MQDIIGCRLIVRDRFQRADLEDHLTNTDWTAMIKLFNRSGHPVDRRVVLPPFRNAVVTDRNQSPRNGYRAVHVIVRDFEHPYEVQIRTGLQNRWAQLAERSDDLFPGTKYGGGHAGVLERLITLSDRIAAFELDEDHVTRRMEDGHQWWADEPLSGRLDRLEAQSRELDGEFRAIEAYLRTVQP